MSVRVYQAAAARAAEERRRLNLGSDPVMDMKALVETQGVLVYSTPVEDGSLSGCFALINGDAWMLVNTAQTVGRQRFTIAHEYCHSLVDRNLKFVVCTREKPPHEKFADAFAAAFLMPADATLSFFSREEGRTITAERVVDYCYAFGVSYQAAVYRLGGLQIVSPKHQRALFGESPLRLASAMGYDLRDTSSPFFFGDCECAVSADTFPRAYRSAALQAFEQELISESKLAELLGVDADDLDDLLDPVETADVPVAW